MHFRIALITAFLVQAVHAQVLEPKPDDGTRVTVTGTLKHVGDAAAVQVESTVWQLELANENQRKLVAKWIGNKVSIVGELKQAKDATKAKTVIRVLGIRNVRHTVLLRANDDGTLKEIQVDEVKGIRDADGLRRILTAVRPIEIAVRYDKRLQKSLVTEYQVVAHTVGGKVGTRRISVGPIPANEGPPLPKDPKLGKPVAPPEYKIGDLAWLSGRWYRQLSSGEVEEYWSEPKGGIMLGVNRSISGKDTTFEFLRIAQVDGLIVYYASPGGRPPTPFTLTKLTKSGATFQNPSNEFPQRIIYVRTGDRLRARIEGKAAGKDRFMEWTWSRTPIPQ